MDENRHARKGGAWALEVISRTWCHPAPVGLCWYFPASCVPILSCEAEERHRMHPAKFCGDACRSSATGRAARGRGAGRDRTRARQSLAGRGPARGLRPVQGGVTGDGRPRPAAPGVPGGRRSGRGDAEHPGPVPRGVPAAAGTAARVTIACGPPRAGAAGVGVASVLGPPRDRCAAGRRSRRAAGPPAVRPQSSGVPTPAGRSAACRDDRARRGRPGDQMSTAFMSSACATNSPPSSASRAEPGSRRIGRTATRSRCSGREPAPSTR